MKTWPLLSLVALLAACQSGTSTPGAATTVSASKSTVTLSNTGTTTDNAATTFTFTNRAGARSLNVSSATVKYGAKTAQIPFGGFTVPAGVSCADAAGGASGANCPTNSLQFVDQTVTRDILDSDLFGKLVSLNPTSKSFPVVLTFPGVSNSLNFTVNVGAAATPGTGGMGGGPITAAPSPLLVVNNTETGPVSNILSVTVSGGFPAGVQPGQVILEVTDSRGIVDTTSYTANSNNATFSVDTSKYPDGTLRLRAIAVDADKQRGESGYTDVQVQNLSAPGFILITPTTGQLVNGTLVAQVQIRRTNTDFTFSAAQSVTFNVRDYRGQIIRAVVAPVTTTSNPGVYEATATFDMVGPDFPNNVYTVEALTSVRLSGEGAFRALQAQAQVTTQNTNNRPPSLIIQMPARPDNFDLAAKRFPVLSRGSAVMVQISDDNNIYNLQMQLSCDDSIKAVGQVCPTSAYQTNIPVTQGVGGLNYQVINIGVLIDGTPYVPNGNYILRFTTTDTVNTNIQEIPVTVDRNRNTIAGLTAAHTLIYGNNCPQALSVDNYLTVMASNFSDNSPNVSCPTSNKYSYTLDRTANSVRVIALDYLGKTGIQRETPNDIAIAPELPAGSTIVSGLAPTDVGIYATDLLVEDLTTGVVRLYSGSNAGVKTNK